MLNKQTDRAEIKAIHGRYFQTRKRYNTVVLGRYHNTVTTDRMWTGGQQTDS